MNIIESHIVPTLTEPIRLQEYAANIFKTIHTRSGIKKAIKRQEILIDGETANTSHWMHEGQKIELLTQKKIPKKVFQLKIEVIYEDNFLAVINKPAGYPTNGNYFKTIENALPFNLSVSEEPDALPYPVPVHRLDNPTGGLLLIAKTRNAQIDLNQAFEAKTIQKSYAAIVRGETPELMTCTSEIDEKQALTEIISQQHFQLEKEHFSLVRALPKTGRTHQIRIHLAAEGFPIVGDDRYGKHSENDHPKKMFLTSVGLQFMHPITTKSMHFEIPLPTHFHRFFSEKKFSGLTKL